MIFDALFGGALTILVEQTNIYAKETKKKAWQDTTVEEMKGFLAILIRMGILQLQNRRDYWSTDSDLGVASVNSVMPRARFFQLLRSLHANDNKTATRKGDVRHDPLHKLRPLITELSETFRASYQPSAYHSIDESMILFKGRKSFKHYMPMKPIKRGFKVWVRADATTGFISQFEVYTGKEGDGGGLGYRDLFDHGIYAVGTVRAQRKGLPDVVKNKKKINEGDHNYKVKGNVAAIQWQDKRLVNVVTTAHDPSETVTVEKKNKDASKRSIKCPLAIVQYTKHMRRVDRFDQLRVYHTVTRKSRKWWMRIFYFLLDCALVNSFILYQL
ncbi:piggyBac transposable element-derived protein 4-like [Ixodes scapularis]|uniref:piggyBac transposable element-derived protein 4-like n=1 Tax=Ixodes scapularis TaxID=6945 RepID=UPI001A9E5CC9|nr:piggyBac transposable element-derived protein 4-like [Ixodes scapularis]